MHWLVVKQSGTWAPALSLFSKQGRKVRSVVTVLGYEERRVSLRARHSWNCFGFAYCLCEMQGVLCWEKLFSKWHQMPWALENPLYSGSCITREGLPWLCNAECCPSASILPIQVDSKHFKGITLSCFPVARLKYKTGTSTVLFTLANLVKPLFCSWLAQVHFN